MPFTYCILSARQHDANHKKHALFAACVSFFKQSCNELRLIVVSFFIVDILCLIAVLFSLMQIILPHFHSLLHKTELNINFVLEPYYQQFPSAVKSCDW